MAQEPSKYDPEQTSAFYDAYGGIEWDRLESSAYGRLQAIIHADFLQHYVQSGQTVLDAGAGPGRFSIQLASLGTNVTILDRSRRQVEIAKGKVTPLVEPSRIVGLLVGDVISLPFSSQSFDATVCFGGALSYVCDKRWDAVQELVRVTKPRGVLLTSVMSRYGAYANFTRAPFVVGIQNYMRWDLWRGIETGDQPPVPSSKVADSSHPAMHLFASEEIKTLFTEAGCEVLEMAGSNVAAVEGNAVFDEVCADEKAWKLAIELERKLNKVPGLLDSGSHIIVAARRLS